MPEASLFDAIVPLRTSPDMKGNENIGSWNEGCWIKRSKFRLKFWILGTHYDLITVFDLYR